MEEYQDVAINNTEAKIELIYYLNEDEEKKGNLKFSYDKNIEIISYGDIANSFYSFLIENQENEIDNPERQNLNINENNIIYDTIRYFDGEGWIILKENDVIFLDEELTLDNLKIMIYSDIICEKEMNIKKKYDKIDKEISYIYKQITTQKNNDSSLEPYAPLNLVVLTSNPLMNDKKELRIINEFNMITNKIYNLFEEEDYLKYTEFLPLTLNTFKNAITNEQKRPVILHLICKSTYIYPEQDKNNILSGNSEDYTNLIFEDDKKYYNLEFINKKKLEDEIFNNPKMEEKVKENIKKIILIISTPLSKDVYNIFSKFGFKNILVQHTTLADLEFIADFNYTFYSDIITHLPQPINNIYEDASNNDITYEYPQTFCCCFHQHKTNCEFFKNLVNELYNNNGPVELEKFRELVPHFSHLYPDCYHNGSKCEEIIKRMNERKEYLKYNLPEKSFCFHRSDCLNSFKYFPKISEDTITYKHFYNFCCCKEDPHMHNENSVFLKNFSAEENNNEIRFRNSELMKRKLQYSPNCEKIISFIGNNEVIFKTLEFFSSSDKNFNIYGDKMENLIKFGDVIIEYFLERHYYFESIKSKSNLNRIKSANYYNINKDNTSNNLIYNDSDFHSIKSSPLLEKRDNIIFEKIKLNDEYTNTSKKEFKFNNNTIYFIYVYVYDESFINKMKLEYNKVVWFSENEIMKKSVEFIKEPILLKEKNYMGIDKNNLNNYIKFQHTDIVRNYWRRK